MSQQEQISANIKPWVMLSSLRDDTNPPDVERIVPQIQALVDEWQSAGKIMWSGPLDNEKSGMAVFEAEERDAKNLFGKYNKICDGILDCYLYQWDAMPLLSVLSK